MAIEHILTDFDTIRSLAAKYNVSWQDIVDYNSLEYPYILDSQEAYNTLYASGYVKITRQFYDGPLTIYAGSRVCTGTDDQNICKRYEVVNDTTIPAGSPSGYVFVRSAYFGSYGNTIAHTINQDDGLITNLGEFLSGLTIDNEEPFTGGNEATVKITGQSIYIPTDIDPDALKKRTRTDILKSLEALGGQDIALGEDFDLIVDDLGDIGSVSGFDNIVQAVSHRLQTERGTDPLHPEYGTGLSEIIGGVQSVYTEKLAILDIRQALAFEDRLDSFEVLSLTLDGTSALIDLSLTVGQNTSRVQVPVTIGGV